MSELPILVSCDCGYRDVRQGGKAHQKTCGVRVVTGQRSSCAQQEQDATERGESYVHIYFILLYSYLQTCPVCWCLDLHRQISNLIYFETIGCSDDPVVSIQLWKHSRFDTNSSNLDRKANKAGSPYSDKNHVMTRREPTSEVSCLSNILQTIYIVQNNNEINIFTE